MNTQEIIENNKLIASFMGIDTSIPHDRQNIYMYDISWDWLSTVLQKIQNSSCIINIKFITNYTSCQIICLNNSNNKHNGKSFFSDTRDNEEPIMVIYKCVVEFLKYLDNNK